VFAGLKKNQAWEPRGGGGLVARRAERSDVSCSADQEASNQPQLRAVSYLTNRQREAADGFMARLDGWNACLSVGEERQGGYAWPNVLDGPPPTTIEHVTAELCDTLAWVYDAEGTMAVESAEVLAAVDFGGVVTETLELRGSVDYMVLRHPDTQVSMEILRNAAFCLRVVAGSKPERR